MPDIYWADISSTITFVCFSERKGTYSEITDVVGFHTNNVVYAVITLYAIGNTYG